MHAKMLVLALLLACPLAAQDYAALETLFLHESIRRHDLDAHAQAVLKVMEARPDSVEALLALGLLMDLREDLADDLPLHDALQRLSADDFRACGRWADEYAQAWVVLARERSTDLGWQAVARRWRGVTEFAWVGPFAETGPAAHDDCFAPEAALDFAAVYDGPFGPVRWQPVRHFDPLDEELNLFDQLRHPGCGHFLATVLVSEAERPVVLKLALDGPAKLWLNGEPLLDADTRKADLPDAVLAVNLRRGRNLLLLKISAVGTVALRLREPSGAPPAGVLAEVPGADTPLSAMRSGPFRFTATTPPEAEALLAAQPVAPREQALRALALGLIYGTHTLREQSSEYVEDALAAQPKDALVRLHYLRMTQESPLYARGERQRLQREIPVALLADEPGLVPARLLLAQSLARDDRFAEAAAQLELAAREAPGNFRIPLELAALFQRAGWPAEWGASLRRALALAPDAPAARKAAARYYSLNDALGLEVEQWQAMLKVRPGQRDALATLITRLLRLGDNAGALKLARQQVAAAPGSEFALQRLAEVQVASGALAGALECYEELAKRSPTPEEALHNAARACLQLGDDARAQELLARVLKHAPERHTARRQLQRMRGESEDCWSAHAVTLDEARRHDIKPAEFPRANSCLLLDELIQYVYPDGSSLSFVHQVRKVLTQAGVDERGRERPAGEILWARTIKPDGRVLEPITHSGNQIEYPGVEIGALLDLAYLVRTESNAWNSLMGDRFFFGDDELREPFAISRFVVNAPAGMRLEPRLHNLLAGPGVTIKREAAEGRVVFTWDVRKPVHPEQEVFMPSALEFIPWVEFVLPRDWRRKGRELADDALPRTRTTRALRAHASTLTAGLTTDEAKARAIYQWVNANITTTGDAANAHQALKAKAGDREALFVALCAAAGVKLGFAAADQAAPFRAPEEEDLALPFWMYPRVKDFARQFVVVQGDNGEPVYLTLSERLRPFGDVPARWAGASAIVWQDARLSLTQLPGGAARRDRFENRAVIELAADGSATLKGSITQAGDRCWGDKDALRSVPQDELCTRLEQEIAGIFPGFEVERCLFPDLEAAGKPLTREFEGRLPALAEARDGGLVMELPAEKLGALLAVLVGQEKRETDIVLDFELHQDDEVRIKPPEGFAFKDLPADVVFPAAPVLYSLTYRLEGGELVIRRTLALGPGRVGPHVYGLLTEQVRKVREAEGVRLELARAE